MDEAVVTASGPAGAAARATAQDLMQMVLWGVVILIILVAGTFALVRFSRRFRAYLLRAPGPPTTSEDVWRMHRLPENRDDEDES